MIENLRRTLIAMGLSLIVLIPAATLLYFAGGFN